MTEARILIVEDETISAMEIESSLQNLGYEVTSVVNTGDKAIAEADRPDLILMDIRIQGELDGIDTAEQIKNRFGIPVVFSTAYLDEKRDVEEADIISPQYNMLRNLAVIELSRMILPNHHRAF